MSQLISGLVSITFRALSPQQVIDLVVQAKLRQIEWGGDIHVPHGDLARAKEVHQRTGDAGLSIAAYGSYYRLGESDAKGLPFERVLETAVALGAPAIRVWAGGKGSRDASATERSDTIADAIRIVRLAEDAGVSICLEYHDGTLADTRESVRRLMEEIHHPNLAFLWQPSHGETADDGVARLRDILPRLRHVHVFHWWPNPAHRRPLAEGEERWLAYLDVLRGTGKPIPCLLEFVRDDSPEQFLQDAATLLRWIAA